MNEHLVQLLLTHAQIVFKYLRKIGASKEDAEDVVQEAIEYIDQVQLDSMRAWLFKVALHRYYTLYKKQKIVSQFTDEELATLQHAFHLEEQIEQNEQQRIVLEALQGLQDHFQQLLILKYFSDLSYKEIAAIVDVSEAHVKTYLARARKALRKKLEEIT